MTGHIESVTYRQFGEDEPPSYEESTWGIDLFFGEVRKVKDFNNETIRCSSVAIFPSYSVDGTNSCSIYADIEGIKQPTGLRENPPRPPFAVLKKFNGNDSVWVALAWSIKRSRPED